MPVGHGPRSCVDLIAFFVRLFKHGARVCVCVRRWGAQTVGVTGWRSVPALDRDHRFGKGRLGAAANGLNTAWQRSARKQLFFSPCLLLWLAPVIAGRTARARRRHRQRARCDSRGRPLRRFSAAVRDLIKNNVRQNGRHHSRVRCPAHGAERWYCGGGLFPT